MKNRRIGIMVCLILVISVIMLPISGSENKNKDVNMSSLEFQVVTYNLELKRAKENLMIAGYKLQKADEAKGMSKQNIIETQKNQKYYVQEAQMNVEYETWKLKEKQEELIIQAKEYYYNYLLLLKEINLQGEKIERLNGELVDLKTKVEQGLLQASAIDEKQLTLEKEEVALTALANQKTSLFLELNLIMNYEFDTTLIVEELEIPDEIYSVEDLVASIKKAIETNGDIIKIDQEGDLLSLESSIYYNNNTDKSYDNTIIKINEQNSEKSFDYQEAKLNLEYDIRSAYNNLLNLADECTIQELAIENLEIDLEIAEKRFEVGLTTDVLLAEIKEQIEFKKLALEKAQLGYYIAVEKFKNMLQ